MPHHPPSVSWQQAREILHRAGLNYANFPGASTSTQSTGCGGALPAETLALKDAIGRHLADDVRSIMPVPHYDSSAMDGYAVAGQPPWQLIEPDQPKDDRVNIHRLTVAIAPGQATPVLTGGLILPGAQAVLRQEHAVRCHQGNVLDVLAGRTAPAPGADIRRTGSEVGTGELLARRGQQVNARTAAFLGMSGFDELSVYQRVRLRCAFTGNEVITGGVPQPGQVRDAFGGFMEVSLQAAGCAVLPSARLADTHRDFAAFLADSSTQVLIFTGGSSTSTADMVRATLARASATYLFESVRVRPGHPALAARLADGRIVLGLPGNPLAAYTALYSYLPPLLAGMRGLPLPPFDTLPLSEGITAPACSSRSHSSRAHSESQRLVPVVVCSGSAYPLKRRASYMLSSLAQATHLAVLDARAYTAGQPVNVLPVF